jgi:intracellular septation protein
MVFPDSHAARAQMLDRVTDRARSMTNDPQQTSTSSPNSLLELGPLVIFIGMYFYKGMFWATGALMVAMSIALLLSWILYRKVTSMMLVATVAVLLFGSLTLYFQDPKYIKLKVTLVNLCFAAILFGGVLRGKYFARMAFGQAFQLTEPGWKQLSLRFAGLFAGMAAANELVWANFSEATWALFKFPGLFIFTSLFALSQMPFIQSVSIPQEESAEDSNEEPDPKA